MSEIKVPNFDTRQVDELAAAEEIKKRCTVCGKLFTSEIGNLERRCPKCRRD